mmetsp:Transcript_18768/g.40658  ORF Transcript_18768/g.40658 Transcript_18768/m.40658 type:complete len:183 (+) Transcript_18768:335-883(+)
MAARFTNADHRLKAAQRELALAQHHMEQVRKQMRAEGNFEPDSLFFLFDGGNEHVLSTVMEYLTIEEAGRCEMVCQTLKRLAKHCWEMLEKRILLTTHRSTAQNARERVIRYYFASTLARQIGGMRESISKHLYDIILDYNEEMLDVRVPDCCEGCDFPDELDFRALHRDSANDFELFVRFS